MSHSFRLYDPSSRTSLIPLPEKACSIYLGAPISLGFGAGEGTSTFCSKDGHGPQAAGTGEEKSMD